jgi:protein-disulfide isomerase-like protein with CxxC motif
MTDAGEAITINTSVTRCAAYILPSLDHLPAPIIAERTRQVIGFVIRACSDQSRLMDSDPPARAVLSVEDFTVNLVDTIVAILQAPTSVASGPAAAGA